MICMATAAGGVSWIANSNAIRPPGCTLGCEMPGPHTHGTSLGVVPREQKMLKGHLPRVIYHQIFI